jgi:Bacterial antitoxin of type II TA system, VapB
MKTTLDISDALFNEAKAVARRRGTTLRSVVESALRQYLDDPGSQRRPAFRLRRHAFKGRGLQPGLVGASWDQIREISYGERSGG